MSFCKIVLVLMLTTTVFGQQKFQVYFDFNKDIPNALSSIEMSAWLLENKNVEIVKIIGYCDSVDKNDYNKELAVRRINTILKVLKNSNLVLSENLIINAVGEDFMLSKNQSENRKVDIFYTSLNLNKISVINQERNEDNALLDDKVTKEKITLAKQFAKAKQGDLIRIHNINFYFNSEKIMEKSMPLLEELFQILSDYPKLRIEIHGHICCNPNPMDTKLSYRRALVIYKYLVDNGISIERLAYKGIGSNDPIYPVPERTESQRAANRRVEILIVDK